jgi:hypothetical protein
VTAQYSTNSTTTYHLPLTENRLPENMTKDPLSEFFLNKRTWIYARGLQGIYPQKRFLVFPMIKIQDPPTFCSKYQEARGLHSVSALFFLKKRTSLRRLLQEKIISRLLFERTQTKLVSPNEARETKRLSSSTMKRLGAYRCGTHRAP